MTKKHQKKYEKTGRLPKKNQRAPAPQRGIIYLRPTHWADSLLAQETLCRTFCAQNDIDLIDVYSDPGEYVSELSILESNGFNDLLDYCSKNKVDALVVVSRDRLGTNTSEYLKCKIDLHKEGVEILSVTDVQPIDCTMEHICEITEEYKRMKKV
ncbi:MAG TPA: recombinase family protein [Candidatus Paceibacterota bacterium]|uniref:Resolvase/invertase-type recombinase catalytic domain-containing protein n=1 Tax=Candidatus Zambryskibacteria bacterium RIFCSPHIGHO2_01_FULL_49_18 TaxID=1802740 RepID=A0A1G2T3J1_9BACT|nr:MAG: hypothetical protein A2758_03300 [Candidatus Zambryskibacteria bacterium RIFCSPHIGHO2_01_FULL_49_18]